MTRAALLMVLGAAMAGAPAPREARAAEPATLYRCQHRIANPGGHSGALTLDKTFREDGSVQSFSVNLEDWEGSFIRRRSPSDRAMATLRWPGRHLVRDGGPFSWGEGSIDVAFLSPGRFRVLPKERWRQVVVDRNRSVIVHETDGLRTLFLSGLDMRLVSELAPVYAPGRLYMSLDNLLAWGNGVEALTVYETLVRKRRTVPDTSSNSPVGRMRVVAEYEVDVAALGRKAAQVREDARLWEAGLTDFRKTCERGVEESGEIIVTQAGAYSGWVSYLSITQGSSWAASTHSRSQGWASIASI